jgi:hypothetical protein
VRTAGRLLRALVCAVAVLAAYGWLDLLRHVPGPLLPLVLPLRANGRGDGVSLVTVLLVFGATFAAIARIAPPRLSRITRSALVRSALLVVFTITVGALQQGIVEQSRPSFAWGSALSLAWPWLAAAAALCGTLAAAPRARREPEPPPVHEPLPQPISAEEPRPLEASVA